MPTPKVSVIVCTYNQEDTIGRSLDSILSQKVDFPYEIILADDCSQDSTPSVCREYAERYPDIIRLFLNKENKGLTDNYFDSIEECRGTYIADLAGDDVWTDSLKLQKQFDIMERDSDISLCHADWQAVYLDGSMANNDHWRMSDFKISMPGELTGSLLRHENDKYFIHLCTAMYRRDKIMELMEAHPGLFRDKYLTCEDLQIKVLMSSVGKIAYLPDKVLNYTVGIPSLSSTENPVKTIRFYSGSLLLTLHLADALGIDRSFLNGYSAEVMQYIIMQYFTANNKEGRELVYRLLGKEKIFLSKKNKITLLLSKNTALWRLTNKIRSAVVKSS